MKYSGAGGQSSRQEVEACEKKLGEANAAQERVKTRHGRMTKVFVDIRAGIEHMSDKLEPVKLDQPAYRLQCSHCFHAVWKQSSGSM